MCQEEYRMVSTQKWSWVITQISDCRQNAVILCLKSSSQAGVGGKAVAGRHLSGKTIEKSEG